MFDLAGSASVLDIKQKTFACFAPDMAQGRTRGGTYVEKRASAIHKERWRGVAYPYVLEHLRRQTQEATTPPGRAGGQKVDNIDEERGKALSIN